MTPPTAARTANGSIQRSELKADPRRRTTGLKIIAGVIVALALSACAGGASGTRIESAALYPDPSSSQPTDSYGWLDVFYCVVKISNPEPGAAIKASWVVIDTDRTRPDMVIKIEEQPADREQIVFTLENIGHFWPTGDYRLYLYLNDKEVEVLDFKVVIAEVPE